MITVLILGILMIWVSYGYTSYLKWVRDTQRITDLASIENMILDTRHSSGKYPLSSEELNEIIAQKNNGGAIIDPLDTKILCLSSAESSLLDYCSYLYNTCDGGEWYILSARFETRHHAQKYSQLSNELGYYYHVGRCSSLDLPAAQTIPSPEMCRTKADCVTDSVCVWPPPKHCRPKNTQWVWASCDTNDDCLSNKCKKKICEA